MKEIEDVTMPTMDENRMLFQECLIEAERLGGPFFETQSEQDANEKIWYFAVKLYMANRLIPAKERGAETNEYN